MPGKIEVDADISLLNTSEKVTKRLRDKSVPFLQLIPLASALLNEKLPIFLPKKHMVVLEWWIDRALKEKHDKGHTNSSALIDGSCWQLISETLAFLYQHEEMPRIHAASLLTIVTNAFDQAYTSDRNLQDSFYDAFAVFFGSYHWFHTNPDASIALLSSYLSYQTGSSRQASSRDCSLQILGILKSSVYRSADFKKLMTLFYANCASNAFTLLDSNDNTLIQFVWQQYGFPDHLVQDSLQLLDTSLGKSSTNFPLDPSNCALLFGLFTGLKGSGQYSEEMFSQLVESCPTCTISLFRICTEKKLKLSRKILLKISSLLLQSESPDWDALELVLKLDSDVILEDLWSNFTLKFTSGISLAVEIVKAFAKSREFPGFFYKWSDLLKQNGDLWSNEDIIKQVAASCSSLSSSQASKIFQEFAQKTMNDPSKSIIIPLISLITFQLSSPSSSVISLLDLEPVVLTATLDDSDQFVWRLRYLSLCLFHQLADVCNDSFYEKLVVKRKDVESIVILRQLEVVLILQEQDPRKDLNRFSVLIKRLLLKPLKKDKFRELALPVLTRRWLVVINVTFDQDQLDTLISFYQKSPDNFKQLCQSSLFHEQSKLAGRVLNLIEQNPVNHTEEIISLPIQLFTRKARQDLLDELIGNGSSVQICLLHLLQRPSFSSKIESDPKVLLNALSSSNGKELCKQVIQHHFSNISEKSSEDFIDNLLKLSWHDLNQSCTVISCLPKELLETRREMIEKLFSKVTQHFRALDAETDTDSSLLSYVNQILRIGNIKIPELIKYVGRLLASSFKDLDSSFKTASLCLSTLCLTSQDFDKQNIMSIIAVYLGLQSHKRLDILAESDFISFLSKLSAENYEYAMTEVIFACFQPSSLPQLPYYETLCCFSKAVNHEIPPKIFTRVISLSYSRLYSLDSNSLNSLLQFIDILLREKPFLVTQFGLELILALITKLSENASESISLPFLPLCSVLSAVLLFHRHRLNGRHHLIIGAFSSLLKCLTLKKKDSSCRTVSNAAAYSRLLGNLCEPPVHSVRERGGKNNLTSSESMAKKTLANHIYILLANYIVISVRMGFPAEVKAILNQGFYLVFDIMGRDGSKLAHSLLNSSERGYFRSVYADYQQHGKWKEE